MLLVTHTAFGALTGVALGNPFLAAGAGFLSHFLLDMVPHGDADLYKNYKHGIEKPEAIAHVVVDSVLAIIAAVYLMLLPLEGARVAMAAGIFGSILPDLVIGIHELFAVKWLEGFHRMHFFYHNLLLRRSRDIPHALAFVVQLVGVFLLIGAIR